ncbi:acyl carrier protein [Merdibacter massiliensis]|uniref:acyl carrier protein n=1 Tax=Merdibacter massiliensis TaxID=1871030 RepID=UPI00096ABBC1|nr:phosphopantetheine-binding protein [Merdibacter massiliensis]
MEKLIALLSEICPDVDFENCTTLIDDGLLDSFAILEIVAEINDTFDVEITAPEIIPENFNSAKALWEMIQRLQG